MPISHWWTRILVSIFRNTNCFTPWQNQEETNIHMNLTILMMMIIVGWCIEWWLNVGSFIIVFSAVHPSWWAAEGVATRPGRVLYPTHATIQGTEWCPWGPRLHVLLHSTIWRIRSVNQTWQLSVIHTTLIHSYIHSPNHWVIHSVSWYVILVHGFLFSVLNHLNCVKIIVRTIILSCNLEIVHCIFLKPWARVTNWHYDYIKRTRTGINNCGSTWSL